MEKQSLDHITSQNLVTVTSLNALVQGYVFNCRCEGKSPKTVSTYEAHLKRFLSYCQQNKFPDNPHKIDAYHIRSFLQYVSSEPIRWGGNSTSARKPAGQSTVNHYYRVLNTFFRWLKQEGLINSNPLSHIKTPKIEQKVVQALSPKEAQALLSNCPSKTALGCRDKAIIMMFLDGGLRVSELATLELADIDMDTGAIVVRHGKGGKQRIVRIGSTSQKALWRYLTLYRRGNSDRLFLTRTGEPLEPDATKLMVRRLGKKAGIPDVHVHRMRHTFAISYLRAGGDIFTLKYLLGHSSLSMVENYLKSLNAEDAARAHQRFSPMDNLKLRI
jgi:site-specific recombinase XerD